MSKFSIVFEGDRKIREYPELANEMERYTFYSMQVYEHIPYKPAWPIVFLAARQTRSIRIGPVTVPVFLSEPIILARNFALLDELTEGRALLGISRGAYQEFLSRQVQRSITSVIEALELLDSLLKGRGYQGQIHKLPEGLRIPWLVGRRGEIYVGTSGPKLCALASKIGCVTAIVVDNLWNPEYAKVLRRVIDESSEGRRVELVARPFTFVSESREQAQAGALEALSHYLPHLVGDSPMIRAAGITFQQLASITAAPKELASKLVANFAAVGSADEIILQTQRMIEAGVDHVCFGHPLGRDAIMAIRELGEKVMPSFGSRE